MPSIFIKNMVCERCVLVVQQQLQSLGISQFQVSLGKVEVQTELSPEQAELFRQQLKALGFEWIGDKDAITVESIKKSILHLIRENQAELKQPLSHYLQREIGQSYSQLSVLFSQSEGTTIEKYYIAQKIERVKELLSYQELSLSEIADRLNYSSVGYLSNQFKKIVGVTPTDFRLKATDSRSALDKIF